MVRGVILRTERDEESGRYRDRPSVPKLSGVIFRFRRLKWFGRFPSNPRNRYKGQVRVHPKFLISALSPAQFPEPSVPEIAFLGRSNVGKSSLLNALLGSKQAKVSSTPGRTRSINFFSITDMPQRQQPQMYFADLPGYGYAKISKSISAEWPKFIEPYLAERPTLSLCLCLVDSNIPPQESDAQLIHFLKSVQREFLVVATKADKLSGNGRTQAHSALTKGLETDHLLLCSAKTGAGLKDLWSAIHVAVNPA
jgi:GTP-binding protein